MKSMIERNRSGHLRCGFTLIELLVVVSIIALLVAILMPALHLARMQSRITVCGAHLKQVGLAMVMYSDNYNESIPPDNGEMHGYVVYRDDIRINGKLRPHRWAYLYELHYIDQPEMFYCPANRLGWAVFENYNSPTRWGTLPQDFNAGGNEWIRIGYSYWPIKRGAQSGFDKATKYSKLYLDMPYATDLTHGLKNVSHQRRAGRNDETYKASNQYSLNALYPDGHVSSCKEPTVFQDPVWDNFPDYETLHYTLFKLIGRYQ